MNLFTFPSAEDIALSPTQSRSRPRSMLLGIGMDVFGSSPVLSRGGSNASKMSAASSIFSSTSSRSPGKLLRKAAWLVSASPSKTSVDLRREISLDVHLAGSDSELDSRGRAGAASGKSYAIAACLLVLMLCLYYRSTKSSSTFISSAESFSSYGHFAGSYDLPRSSSTNGRWRDDADDAPTTSTRSESAWIRSEQLSRPSFVVPVPCNDPHHHRRSLCRSLSHPHPSTETRSDRNEHFRQLFPATRIGHETSSSRRRLSTRDASEEVGDGIGRGSFAGSIWRNYWNDDEEEEADRQRSVGVADRFFASSRAEVLPCDGDEEVGFFYRYSRRQFSVSSLL